MNYLWVSSMHLKKLTIKEVIAGKEFTVMQVALKTSVTDLNQKFFCTQVRR